MRFSTNGRKRTALFTLLWMVVAVVLFSRGASPVFGQRVMGLDTSSAANTSAPSQALWNTAFADGYRFAFLRSSRGGTSDATRVDDGHFYDNITRATTAGMLTGSYHFARPDVTTHTAVDDANHYLERAGRYMKPGYLLPVFDLEDGNSELTTPQMTAWSMDFVNTIFNATGVYPIVYTNGLYNNDEVGAELAWINFGSTPKTNPRTYQWVARPGSDGLTGNPPPSIHYNNPYGVWDPNFVTRTNSRDPAVKPWVFWQQTLNTTPTGLFKIDINYANGNIEFVKDFLVPALWTTAGSGDWGTIANWNSNNPGGGTPATGPASRLPNSLDWVKLQNGSHTVTLSSGAQSVRKFYTQQPLNISGGSLTVGYVPGDGGKWDLPSEFNAAVTISGGGAYSAHTTQVDGGGGQFNINGGTVTFTEIQLASHATNSGKIVMGGDATFAPPGGSGTSVIRSTGSLAQAGSVSLSAGNRTFIVNNGSAGVDLNVRTGISGAGRLVKSGAGTMQLSSANTYTGGTTIVGGVLQIAAENRLGSAAGGIQPEHIVLDGGTLKTGAQVNTVTLTNPGSGYSSFPAVTIGGAGADVHPALANVLAGISAIAVTAGGSNYGPGAFVDFIGGGGSGATATATITGGVITGITVTNPGSGYTSLPTIYISGPRDTNSASPNYGWAGSGATAQVSGIVLQSIALADGGFDYTTPTLSLTGGGGSGATASATSSPSLTLSNSRGVTLTASGGTLHQTAGTLLTVGGIISSSGNGTLTKAGPGTLVVSGANTYTGGTTVAAGVLSVSGATAKLGAGPVNVDGTTAASALQIQSGVANAINNAATLSLAGGSVAGVADTGYIELQAGVNETIGALQLAGAVQLNGRTYGSSTSAALVKLDDFFAGPGMVTVGLPGDFNADSKVNLADYVVWRSVDGTMAAYNMWRQNFGVEAAGAGTELIVVSQSQGSSIPEPSTIGLVVFSLAVLVGRRHRR